MGSCCHSDWLSDYVAHLRINKDTILTEFTIPITDYWFTKLLRCSFFDRDSSSRSLKLFSDQRASVDMLIQGPRRLTASCVAYIWLGFLCHSSRYLEKISYWLYSTAQKRLWHLRVHPSDQSSKMKFIWVFTALLAFATANTINPSYPAKDFTVDYNWECGKVHHPKHCLPNANPARC